MRDATCDLTLTRAGTFSFTFASRGNTTGTFEASQSVYIQVPPLYKGEDDAGRFSTLDAVIMKTLMPKWMPVMQEWPLFCRNFVKGRSYNYVHFAPMQERGVSDSPYSIYSQLDISNDHFKQYVLICLHTNICNYLLLERDYQEMIKINC